MIDVTFVKSPKQDGKPWLVIPTETTRDTITTVVLVDSGYVLEHLDDKESVQHLRTSIPRPSPTRLHLLSDYPALTSHERTALAATLGHTGAQGATTPALLQTNGPESLLEAVCAIEGYRFELAGLYMIHPEGMQYSDWSVTAVVGGHVTEQVAKNRATKTIRAAGNLEKYHETYCWG